MPKTSAGPAQRIRIILGTLLVLNLLAAGFILYPPGGSAESLASQLTSLRGQLKERRALVERTREHASSVEKGRSDGDEFLGQYFLGRRAAYTLVVAELGETARRAKLKERENAFAIEGVEGSDKLSMMTVTANYEGTYRDLLAFVREIDRSPLLMVIESLNAAPQTGTNVLSISLKIEAFVREEAGATELPADSAKAVAANTQGAAR